jgi:tetratricopeptide (TPR) repeat protein
MSQAVRPCRPLRASSPAAFVVALFAATSAVAAPLLRGQADPYKPGGGPDGPWAPKDQSMLGGPPPPGLDKAKLWPAPSNEDWKRPCLVHWQRTWEDAVAVSKATGKPIMVCVNMDGEIASEHFAGKRYRDPEAAQLYEPYVCVIASVYRHNARDYDEQGRRIPCPRFGTVTCGEHIAIETVLYEKYFKGKRVAPRHIGVDLSGGDAEGPDGKEAFDVYYAWDTQTIFDNLKDTSEKHGPPLAEDVHADQPIVARVASREARDRGAVESAYEKGDRELRRQLISQALAHPDAAPVDLLRQAVFGLDVDLETAARQALAKSTAAEAIPLINDALAVPMTDDERAALVAALDRLGEQTPRARSLAIVQRGIATRSAVVDVKCWKLALEKAPAAAARKLAEEALRAQQDDLLAHGDANALCELADAFVGGALDPEQEPRFAHWMAMDAESIARTAQERGAASARVHAVLAVVTSLNGSRDDALAHAAQALDGIPSDPGSPAAALVLQLFSESRQREIGKALRARSRWPPEWLSDVDAAYAVLAFHPFGSDENVVARYDLLRWFGATVAADAVLDAGLARFPDSAALHDRMRGRLLAETGADGLEGGYGRILAAKDAAPSTIWFAAYATLVAAEFDCRAGADDSALARYERGIALYEKAAAASPDDRSTAEHYIALALAARANIADERSEDAKALDLMLESLRRSPDSAATKDGLGIAPIDTAHVLLAHLTQEKQEEMAARLQAALDRLDPELLKQANPETIAPIRRESAPAPPAGGAGSGH